MASHRIEARGTDNKMLANSYINCYGDYIHVTYYINIRYTLARYSAEN